MSKEVNYLDIIKRGASRDNTRNTTQQSDQSRSNPNDPLSRFTAPTEINRRDISGRTDVSLANTRDPLGRFAASTESNSRYEQPKGIYGNRTEEGASRSPLRHTTGIASPSKAEYSRVSQAESTYRNKSPVRGLDHTTTYTTVQSTSNYGEARRASRSPGRVSPAKEITNDDASQFRRSNSRNDGYGATEATSYRRTSRSPLRNDDDQDHTKSRRIDNLGHRTSTYQDSMLDEKLRAGAQTFGKYYRDQASARQSTKRTTDEFRRKFREEFERDLRLINSKRQNYIWIFVVIIILILGLFVFFIANINSLRKPFCDTDRYDQLANCIPCPNHGICQGGYFVDCKRGYIQSGNHCVKETVDEAMVDKYYNFALQRLRSIRGEEICHGRNPNKGMSEYDLKTLLNNRFGDKGHSTNIDTAVYKLTDRSNNADIEINNDRTIYATTPSFTAYCAVKMFIKAYKYLLFLLLIVIGVALWFIYKLTKELQTRQKAAKLYKWITSEIINAEDQLMMESSIKRRMASVHGMDRSEVIEIWPYIEKEAQYRQTIEFINKSENGVDERGWWIQSGHK